MLLAKQLKDAGKTYSFDSLDHELLATLARFAQIITQFGYSVSVSSPKSLRKLREVSSDKKIQIINHFSKLIEWVRGQEVTKNPKDIDKICALKALEYFKLKADDSFLETITHDQIIEIYGDDMVQLYRSFNFFNVTGYSLLDMSVFEWYVLWERPSKVIEETLKDTQKALSEYVPVCPFSVSNQPIKEVYDTGEGDVNFDFVPRAISATFCNFGSLKSIASFDPRPKGFICTETADFITIGEESNRLRFI